MRPEAKLTFLTALLEAKTIAELESALGDFASSVGTNLKYIPVGGIQNNRGIIEVATDAGRSVVERVTNADDALLELQHQLHGGRPNCHSPREAAQSWFAVPTQGLSGMTSVQRRQLARNVVVSVEESEGKDSRLLEVRDYGIGLTAHEIPRTILKSKR